MWLSVDNLGAYASILGLALMVALSTREWYLNRQREGEFRSLETMRYILGSILLVGSIILFWMASLPLKWGFVVVAALAIIMMLYKRLDEDFRRFRAWPFMFMPFIVVLLSMSTIMLLRDYRLSQEKRTKNVRLEEALLSPKLPLGNGQNSDKMVSLPVINAKLKLTGFENEQLFSEGSIHLEICNSRWNYLYVKAEHNIDSIGDRNVYLVEPSELLLIKGIAVPSLQSYMDIIQSIPENGQIPISFLLPVDSFLFQPLLSQVDRRTHNLQCRVVVKISSQPVYSNKADVIIQGSEEDWCKVREAVADPSYWDDFEKAFRLKAAQN